MPRKPRTHNRADVKAAIELMQALGKTVTAVKFHPDGTFRVMTPEHVSKSAGNDSPATSFDAWKAKQDAHPS